MFLSSFKPARVAPLLALVYLMVLFYVLLYPFHFSLPNPGKYFFSLQLETEGWPILVKTSNKRDVIQNIVLFFPFGFFIFAWLKIRIQYSTFAVVLAVLAASFMSIMCEALQFFLPTRGSSIFDVGANGIGAALGATVCWFWLLLVEKLKRPSGRRLT